MCRKSVIKMLIIMGCCAGWLSGCQSVDRRSNAETAAQDIELLTQWMTGTFTSARQAERDPEHYRDIRLVMVPVWPQRDDGPWLYVEQAAATRLHRPYRQRVYQLVPHDDGSIESVVYTLPGDPLLWAGVWRTPKQFNILRPESLKRREGCSLFLRRQPDGTFAGSTRGKGCASVLAGAKYAMSEATISPTRLVSWDRGFDADGEQVWGATTGGYVFEKQLGSSH